MSEAAFQIRLAGGDLAYACAPDDTVLRAAQRAGLGFPYECNVGSCGNCKFELVAGEVATAWPEAPGLSDKDRQRKRHLGCQSRPLSGCTVKLRTMDRYVPPHRPARVGAVLRSRRRLTHDISEFHFQLDTPQAFEPGQYALCLFSGASGATGATGVAGPRAYSMSNLDAAVWHFQVRQVPGGAGSAALFGLLPGARVQLDGPYGMAWLQRDVPRDILCLAGGSGLAPMIAIARAAVAEPKLAGRHIHFVYGGRTPDDLCAEDLLRELPGYGERLFHQAFVSTPPPAGSGHRQAFVHEAALSLHGDRLRDMEVYFAGPPAMATAVQAMLLATGVPPQQQHFDQFY